MVLDSLGLCFIIDCVCEMLFNWLVLVMVDVYCLDCFVGSGVLGLEVLLCYVVQVMLLEMDCVVL